MGWIQDVDMPDSAFSWAGEMPPAAPARAVANMSRCRSRTGRRSAGGGVQPSGTSPYIASRSASILYATARAPDPAGEGAGDDSDAAAAAAAVTPNCRTAAWYWGENSLNLGSRRSQRVSH